MYSDLPNTTYRWDTDRDTDDNCPVYSSCYHLPATIFEFNRIIFFLENNFVTNENGRELHCPTNPQ